MNQLEKEGIVSILLKKGVHKPCPRCDSYGFQVADTTKIITSFDIFSELSFSYLDVICIFCSNCGFITFHAGKMFKEN